MSIFLAAVGLTLQASLRVPPRVRSPKSCSPFSDCAAEHVRTVSDFFDDAELLRSTYDGHFAEPRQAHAMRFVWDFWHVPDQYTLHRTQAVDYFEPAEFDALTDALTVYGQQSLGCRAITPP